MYIHLCLSMHSTCIYADFIAYCYAYCHDYDYASDNYITTVMQRRAHRIMRIITMHVMMRIIVANMYITFIMHMVVPSV